MGILRWIKNLIFGEAEPEPEPEPDIIESVIELPSEIWRAVTGEAKEEWREEREERYERHVQEGEEILDREAKEQLSMDLVIGGEWEAAKYEWPEMITDEDLRQKYKEFMGY